MVLNTDNSPAPQGRVVIPGVMSESLAELGMTQRLLSAGAMHEKAMLGVQGQGSNLTGWKDCRSSVVKEAQGSGAQVQSS